LEGTVIFNVRQDRVVGVVDLKIIFFRPMGLLDLMGFVS
jgi:hypothetical protein